MREERENGGKGEREKGRRGEEVMEEEEVNVRIVDAGRR